MKKPAGGLAATINGDGLVLLDYFAVVKALRGQGVGGDAMTALQWQYRDNYGPWAAEHIRPVHVPERYCPALWSSAPATGPTGTPSGKRRKSRSRPRSKIGSRASQRERTEIHLQRRAGIRHHRSGHRRPEGVDRCPDEIKKRLSCRISCNFPRETL